MTSRRTLLLAGFAVLLPLNSGIAATEADSRQQVERFNSALIGIMKAGSTAPFSTRFDMLGQAVDQVFDLDGILETSVGFYWQRLPNNQRDELRTAFRTFVLSSYVSAFNLYDGEVGKVSPDVKTLGARQVVSATLSRPESSGPVTAYVMAKVIGVWRVQDILIDGTISRVAMQRSDFRSFLSEGDATRLIAKLRDKTALLRTSA